MTVICLIDVFYNMGFWGRKMFYKKEKEALVGKKWELLL